MLFIYRVSQLNLWTQLSIRYSRKCFKWNLLCFENEFPVNFIFYKVPQKKFSLDYLGILMKKDSTKKLVIKS